MQRPSQIWQQIALESFQQKYPLPKALIPTISLQFEFAFVSWFDFESIFFSLQTPVYVYYESLCPDSQAFITKQLYPAMNILKDHVDLKLIPFGKSTVRIRRRLRNTRIVIHGRDFYSTVPNARIRHHLRLSPWPSWGKFPWSPSMKLLE